jgi:Tol biopolymer transport system component
LTLAAGTRVGPYEVLGGIGAGGMGEVYRARDTRLEREVAIKVLPAEVASNASRMKRFEHEARSASALNHPNIVTIYDIGQTDGVSWIAMEKVDGKTLRELLAAGALPVKRTLAIGAQVADGLAKAHEARIVHRDLKPENVMVTKDGFVKILDFGLAKLAPKGFEAADVSQPATVTRGTEPGTVMGTVGYMSPEQASGLPVDFRSDQFSLGAILYEMIAGKKAFDRTTPVQTLSAIIQDEPEPLGVAASKTPVNLVWIVERCLAKDPEDRYASSKDLARDLASLRDHASDIGASELPASGRGKHRVPAGIAAVTVVLVGLLAFFGGRLLLEHRIRSERPPGMTQLTFRRGYVTGARFAPDGRTVIYSGRWGGNASELFETRLGSPESRPLRIFPAGILAVSSTGEMAISLGCENLGDPCFGTLARVPASGGAPREVLEGVLSADWSPDGQKLAVSRRTESGFLLEYPLGTVLYRTTGYLSGVRVATDGVTVAFIDHPSPAAYKGRVCLVDSSGKKRELTGDLPDPGGLAWSPKGDAILFASGDLTGQTSGLAAVDLSGRVRELLGVGQYLWDVSRDGRVLVSMGEYGRSEIVALPPGAARERDLSWFSGSELADLSADGRTLLFTEGDSIYTRRTDGADPKLLGKGRALALSPDGKWVLAEQDQPGSRPGLVLLPTGPGERKVLPSENVDLFYFANWFPDSRRFFYVASAKGGPRRSFVQDVGGGRAQRILEDGMMATLVSPDGMTLAATDMDGHAYLSSADGRGKELLKGVLPEEDLIQWSSDGRSLFVRGPEKEALTLFRLDTKTGKRESWKTLDPPDRVSFIEFGSGPRGIRLTPDGRSYAYGVYTSLYSLYLVEGLK